MHTAAVRRRRGVVVVATTLAWVTLAVAPGGPAPRGPAPGRTTAFALGTVAAADAGRPGLVALVRRAGALAFWPLDDRTPAVAHDAIGGHDGTGHGPIRVDQVAQGPTAHSERFDGDSTAVSVPAAGLSGTVQAATAWVRPGRGRAPALGHVLETGGLRLDVRNGRFEAVACATPLLCTTLATRAPVSDGAWHQIGASVAGGVLRAYVDGAAAGSVSSWPATALPRGGMVTIGRRFRGDVDDVAVYAAPLDPRLVAAQFRAGACPQAAGTPPPDTSARRALPALPLHTRGRFVVDAAGHRVKLAGVNWYGAEELDRVPAGLQCESVDAIAAHIAAGGYNVVRLPWATDTWLGRAPRVPPVAVAANPALHGRNARRVFDAVVAALARHGLMVILDNHVTRPGWCCSGADGNALWWTGYDPARPPAWGRMSRRARLAYFRHGQARWLAAWAALAGRYAAGGARPQPAVVGADLRNEPRTDAVIGVAPAWTARSVPPWRDWPGAATRAGDRVLRANPRLLVAVEGVSYATDLRGAAARPVRLARSHRLVYSAHDYAGFHPGAGPVAVRTRLGARWGWLLTQGRPWTTPVWVGEFGTWHPGLPWRTAAEQAWWDAFTAYLRAGDIDWTYWSINGTGARGAQEPRTCARTPRFPGCGEGFGLSDSTWAADASPVLSATLRTLEPATQGP